MVVRDDLALDFSYAFESLSSLPHCARSQTHATAALRFWLRTGALLPPPP